MKAQFKPIQHFVVRLNQAPEFVVFSADWQTLVKHFLMHGLHVGTQPVDRTQGQQRYQPGPKPRQNQCEGRYAQGDVSIGVAQISADKSELGSQHPAGVGRGVTRGTPFFSHGVECR